MNNDLYKDGVHSKSTKGRSPFRWMRFGPRGWAIVILILFAAAWLGKLVLWCPQHNHCVQTETLTNVIRTIEDPRKNEPDALGFIPVPKANIEVGVEPTGPSSFAVSNGVLVVADTVRQRVAVFDSHTLQYRYSMDEFKFPPERVNLSGDNLLVRGGFGLSDNDAICSISNRHCRLLADVGIDERNRLREQQHALSHVENISQQIVAGTPRLVGADTIGRDSSGNKYVLIKQMIEGQGAGVASSVRKYSPEGRLMATSTPIPDKNEVDLFDSVRVDEEGTCYALSVQQARVTIWRWVTHGRH